ncbi:MAG: N-acetyltransferase [Xanthomonadales bacterium PRO7]|nr:N-acetyltransferase [Xanthomonadales bacterium PRO7]
MQRARFHSVLNEIDAAQWNALLPDDNPFLAHAFLSGLEVHGCLDARHGWTPHHLGLYDGGKLAAAAPLYLKTNSHGEYVFDWSWAHAYARHGLDYYPKLLCAVPYSPVTGPRLLGDPSLHGKLVNAIQSECDRLGLSSAHANFCTESDAATFAGRDDWLPRFDWQFHWHNAPIEAGGWRDFDDFLDALKPKKRKNIRQEREHVRRAGVQCEIRHGDEIDAITWRRIHDFYVATFDEKGNHPALTLEFFRHLGSAMPRNVLAVLCRHGDDVVAMALLLRSRDTLYGRYWGCRDHVTGLHFEACYYQGIEYCLAHGLLHFEPGAQGEHKLARGFLPTMTRSFHHIADRRFHSAIADALDREADALRDYRNALLAHSPYANFSLPPLAGQGAEGGWGQRSR